MSGFHNKMGRFLGAAAIDARRRTGLCWHDMAAELLVAAAKDARAAPVHAVKNMAAGAIRILIQYPPNN